MLSFNLFDQIATDNGLESVLWELTAIDQNEAEIADQEEYLG